MKKILIFAFLLFLNRDVYAQAGALKIVNHSTTCSVYVNMYAEAPSEFDSKPCDIVGCGFGIPPSTTVSFTSPYDFGFGSGPGFCYETTAIGAAVMFSITDFIWTDVVFQYYSCSGPCSGGGGSMSTGMLSPIFTCAGASTSCPNPCSLSMPFTWSSTTTSMYDVTIDFY